MAIEKTIPTMTHLGALILASLVCGALLVLVVEFVSTHTRPCEELAT